MKTIKIKIGNKVLKHKRCVEYQLKENVSDVMKEYIAFLVSHHNYTYEYMATSKTEIAKYFKPKLALKKL